MNIILRLHCKIRTSCFGNSTWCNQVAVIGSYHAHNNIIYHCRQWTAIQKLYQAQTVMIPSL